MTEMVEIPANLIYYYSPEEKAILESKFNFGVQEWADCPSINICLGCSNDCLYCYARWGAYFHKRLKNWENWKEVQFNKAKADKHYSKTRKYHRIMVFTTHDFFLEEPMHSASLEFVQKMICEKQIEVLITTKPRLKVIQELCEIFDRESITWISKKGKKTIIENPKQKISFRFTICSADNARLKILEPGAPDLNERIAAMKYAFDAGFTTTLSAEPLLDADPSALIDLVMPYLSPINLERDFGTIWLGHLNTYTPSKIVRKYYGDIAGDLYDLVIKQSDFNHVFEYYKKFAGHPRIRWKESIKRLMIENNVRIW